MQDEMDRPESCQQDDDLIYIAEGKSTSDLLVLLIGRTRRC